MSAPTTAAPVYLHRRDHGWTASAVAGEVVSFHRSLPDYATTPLVEIPALAPELDVARVLVKDESARLGLPAFKALGASWALHRALQQVTRTSPVTVVAATDGNHGRAVARFARRLGHHARIFLPDGVHPAAAQAIRDEGAEVVEIGGSYDHAVAAAARAADSEGALLVQDTAWEGYTDIPAWIVEGYTTLFTEIDDTLAIRGAAAPDLVVVPVGVGSLLQAALTHYRRDASTSARTAVLAAEARSAACLPVSLAASTAVTVSTGATVMAGLNCGTLSDLAWPSIVAGLDASAAVSDPQALQAADDLATLGVPAGPCGAASLAAARIALTGLGSERRRHHLGVDAGSTVILLSTEGTDANPAPQPPPPDPRSDQ